jgi:hypothetical protein
MYNSGNSSKNVTGSAIVDGTVEAADLATAVNNDIADGVAGKATADLALPKAGGALTGAVTTNSTFAGRDVATDGAALDVLDLAINSAADAVAITIDASENVGIGTTIPALPLHVEGPAIGSGVVAPAYFKALKLSMATGNEYGGQAQFSVGRWEESGNAARSSLVISLNHGSTQSAYNADTDIMTLFSNGNTKLNDGNLVIGTAGKGIDFSAADTALAGTTANILDDYEEGTWAPKLTEQTAGTGTYVKVGKLVTVRGYVNADAVGTGAAMQLSALPFAAVTGTIRINVEIDFVETANAGDGMPAPFAGMMFHMRDTYFRGTSSANANPYYKCNILKVGSRIYLDGTFEVA